MRCRRSSGYCYLLVLHFLSPYSFYSCGSIKQQPMLFRLLLREVKRVAHDHSLLLTLLIAPLLYAFFYGSIYSYKTEEEVPIAVVDEDGSGLSQTLIRQIDNTQMVTVAAVTSLEKAKESMYQGHTQGFLYIE